MDKFHKILLVANSLSHKNSLSIQKEFNTVLPKKLDAHILYIIPPIPSYYHQIPSISDLENNLIEVGKAKLQKIGHLLNIPENRHWLIFGQIKTEAKKLAFKIGADVIIMENESGRILKKLSETLSANLRIKPKIPFIIPSHAKNIIDNLSIR